MIIVLGARSDVKRIDIDVIVVIELYDCCGNQTSITRKGVDSNENVWC